LAEAAVQKLTVNVRLFGAGLPGMEIYLAAYELEHCS
jgi:hypothetical protein